MKGAAMSVHLEEIGQIAVTVKDLARAKTFYRDVLGMKFVFDAGTMAFFQCGSVRLLLGTAEPGKEERAGGTILYFKVSYIQAVCNSLRLRGVELVQDAHVVAKMPDHTLWMAFLRDSEGNVLGLMEEVPLSAQ
jgi:methylmalonyl-CoA/ethylmalonyl-CoA epimerase